LFENRRESTRRKKPRDVSNRKKKSRDVVPNIESETEYETRPTPRSGKRAVKFGPDNLRTKPNLI